MTPVSRTVLAMLAVTLLAGAAGGWLGVRYGLREAPSTASLDTLLHREIELSSGQQQQLAAMERSFGPRRRFLEGQMRAANRELAAAILAEHRYGPAARQAIGHFHAAMQALQEATIEHVLAMRTVLTPAQAQRFDRTLGRALDSDQP